MIAPFPAVAFDFQPMPSIPFVALRRFVVPLFLWWAFPIAAQHVGIDRAWATNGFGFVPAATAGGDTTTLSSIYPSRILSLPDGRFYVAVRTVDGITISRFSSEGSADPSFAGAGNLVVPRGATNCELDDAFRLICSYSPYEGYPNIQTNFIRYGVSGNLDVTFGVNGVASLTVPNPGIGYGGFGVVQIRPAAAGGYYAVLFERYSIHVTESGALDTAYGDQGFLGRFVDANALSVDRIGRLYEFLPDAFGGPTGVIQRLLPSGSPDPAYGGATSSVRPPPRPETLHGYLDRRDRLHVVSDAPNLAGERRALVRFSADGTIENSWGQSGVVALDHGSRGMETRVESVADTGEIVVRYSGTVNRPYYSSFYRMLMANGNADVAFGGKGLTRMPDEGGRFIDPLTVAFDQLSGKLLCATVIRDPQIGILAYRLNRSFSHRLNIADFSVVTPSPEFARWVQFSATITGDVGPPSGAAIVSLDDDAHTSVDLSYGSFAFPAKQAGTFTLAIDHPGDDYYGGASAALTPVVIAKARLAIGVPYGYLPYNYVPKLKYQRVFNFAVSVDSGSADSYGPVPIQGYFQLSDGEGGCRVDVSAFNAYQMGGCTLSHKSPGNKAISVRHVGDPNFYEDTRVVEPLTAQVIPAITSLTGYTADGASHQVVFTTSDQHCGLNFAWEDRSFPLADWPKDVVHAYLRERSLAIGTVDDCTPGFAGTIDITRSGVSRSLSGAFVQNNDGTWNHILASGQNHVSIQAVDNAVAGTDMNVQSGRIAISPVFESRDSNGICLFDVAPPKRNDVATVVLRFALGWRGNYTLRQGTALTYDEADFWTNLFDCSACGGEVDVTGDGKFALDDALVISRFLRGYAAPALFAGTGLPRAGGRQLVEIQQFLASGCVAPVTGP